MTESVCIYIYIYTHTHIHDIQVYVPEYSIGDIVVSITTFQVCVHVYKIPWTEEPGRLQSMGS